MPKASSSAATKSDIAKLTSLISKMHSDNRSWKSEILDSNKAWKSELKDHIDIQFELLRKDVFDVQLERLRDFMDAQKDILGGLEHRISRLEQQAVA